MRPLSADSARESILRFDLNGILYCVAQDEVVAFDFASGTCLGTIVQFPRLNGQAIALSKRVVEDASQRGGIAAAGQPNGDRCNWRQR